MEGNEGNLPRLHRWGQRAETLVTCPPGAEAPCLEPSSPLTSKSSPFPAPTQLLHELEVPPISLKNCRKRTHVVPGTKHQD